MEILLLEALGIGAVLGLLLGLTGAGGSLVALPLLLSLHLPLRDAIGALREIRGGNYRIELPVTTGGEVGELDRLAHGDVHVVQKREPPSAVFLDVLHPRVPERQNRRVRAAPLHDVADHLS